MDDDGSRPPRPLAALHRSQAGTLAALAAVAFALGVALLDWTADDLVAALPLGFLIAAGNAIFDREADAVENAAWLLALGAALVGLVATFGDTDDGAAVVSGYIGLAGVHVGAWAMTRRWERRRDATTFVDDDGVVSARST